MLTALISEAILYDFQARGMHRLRQPDANNLELETGPDGAYWTINGYYWTINGCPVAMVLSGRLVGQRILCSKGDPGPRGPFPPGPPHPRVYWAGAVVDSDPATGDVCVTYRSGPANKGPGQRWALCEYMAYSGRE